MHGKARFAYIAEVDISIDDGPGINEREFVHELLTNHPDEVVCVLPYPASPSGYHDARIAYVTSHRGRNPFFYLVYNIALFLKVIKLHRQHPFDALVFRLNLIPLVPPLLHYTLRAPIILKTLAGYTTFSGLAGEKQRYITRLAYPLYKLSISKARLADTVSIPYIEWLEKNFGIARERIVLIPNGANTNLFRPGDKTAYKRRLGLENFDFIIGYVGALATLRHVDLLIKTLQELKTDKKVGLVLVGKGPDREFLQNLAEELKVRDRVVFAGFRPYQEVPDIMKTFDIAVDLTRVPMKIGEKSVDASYSQKIPQYLACGLAVVAWDVPDNGFIESIGIGRLVKPGGDDLKNLSAAIQHLLDLPDAERIDMGTRAREHAEAKFSVHNLTSERINAWRASLRA